MTCITIFFKIQPIKFKPRIKSSLKINIQSLFTGYGITTDGVTTFVNASTVTVQYRPSHPPIVFDIPNKSTLEQEEK